MPAKAFRIARTVMLRFAALTTTYPAVRIEADRHSGTVGR